MIQGGQKKAARDIYDHEILYKLLDGKIIGHPIIETRMTKQFWFDIENPFLPILVKFVVVTCAAIKKKICLPKSR